MNVTWEYSTDSHELPYWRIQCSSNKYDSFPFFTEDIPTALKDIWGKMHAKEVLSSIATSVGGVNIVYK